MQSRKGKVRQTKGHFLCKAFFFSFICPLFLNMRKPLLWLYVCSRVIAFFPLYEFIDSVEKSWYSFPKSDKCSDKRMLCCWGCENTVTKVMWKNIIKYRLFYLILYPDKRGNGLCCISFYITHRPSLGRFCWHQLVRWCPLGARPDTMQLVICNFGCLVPQFADAMDYSFNFWLWRTFFVTQTKRISHGWIKSTRCEEICDVCNKVLVNSDKNVFI